MLIKFGTIGTDPELGLIKTQLHVNEAQPPSSVSEDNYLEVLTSISHIVAHSRGRQGILEGSLREIKRMFPKADRKTIALIEDKELVSRISWPPQQSYMSFTLARQAIKSHQALHWVREVAARNTSVIPKSLYDTAAALYAPMMAGGETIGVIHIDSTSLEVAFSDHQLNLLSVVANTIGAALKSTIDGAHTLPSIFVSYAHKDTDFVNQMVADLRRREVKVWFDERLKSGGSWRDQLATAIDSTDAFALVMSPASVDSEIVNWELNTAQSLRKPILPLMYQLCELPKAIAPLQYIPIGEDYEQSLDQLVGRLNERKR